MTCRQFRERIQLYLAEALPGKWSEQMEAHARNCEACPQALAQARHTLGLLHSLEAPTPPEQLPSRIKAAVRAAAGPRPVPVRSRSRPGPVLVAAGAALVILIGVLVVTSTIHRPSEPTPRVASVPLEPKVIAARPSEPEASASGLSPAPVSTAPARRSPQVPPVRLTTAQVKSFGKDSRVAQESVAELADETEAKRSDEIMPPSAPVVVSSGARTEMQVAALARAQIPISLAQSAPRTDLVSKSTAAEPPMAPTTVEDNELAAALVSGVVANILVDKYVQEAVVGGNETLLRLVTSTPAAPTLSAAELGEEPEAE